MLEAAIQNSVIFHGMSRDEIGDALTALEAEEKTYEKDELILIAGERTDRFGLILDGSVTVESNDAWGNRTILSHIGRGDFFAETYAILENMPLLVDVAANEKSRILFLRTGGWSGGLRNIQGEIPLWKTKLISNLLGISAQKNLRLSGRSFHTSPKTIRGRIMAYLNSVSLQKETTEFRIPFDRQQLADYLNVERTALSKELGRMQRDGLIRVKKNLFALLEVE